jgi:hypothetical protein
MWRKKFQVILLKKMQTILYISNYSYFYIHMCLIFRCTFPSNESCLEWYKRISSAIALPSRMQDVFSFAFKAYLKDSVIDGLDCTHPLCHMCKFISVIYYIDFLFILAYKDIFYRRCTQ